MSRENFFDWAEAQDERYEFGLETPVLMSGGSRDDSRLSVRLLARLVARPDKDRFEALGPDGGVGPIGFRVKYPDAMIATFAGNGTDRLIQEPVAVFEITSPSSSRTDRVIKLRDYALASLYERILRQPSGS